MMGACFDYDCDLCGTHHEVRMCPLQPDVDVKDGAP